MDSLEKVRALIQAAKPIPHTDGYVVPAIIAERRDAFFERVIIPTTSMFDDEYWFERHWVWFGYTKPDGQMIMTTSGPNVPAQRFIWLLLNGPVPEGFFPRPICGDNLCVSPYHLRLRRRTTNGLSLRLQKDIQELFADKLTPFSARELARLFHVSERRIYQILKAKL